MEKKYLTILASAVVTALCLTGCSSMFVGSNEDFKEQVPSIETSAEASPESSTEASSALSSDTADASSLEASTDIVALSEMAGTESSTEEKKDPKTKWVVVKETEYTPDGSVDRTAEYEYDEHGFESVEKNSWSTGQRQFLTIDNKYDDDGKHIEEYVSDSDTGEALYSCEYKYNKKDECVGCIRTYPNGQMFSMYANNGVEYNVSNIDSNNLWSDDRHTLTVYFGNNAITYTFDDKGNLTELISMNGIEMKYDAYGNRTYSNDGQGEEFTCMNEYDENGNRLKEICSDGWYTEYEYKKIELQ